jgi:hypothetical protein
MTDRALALDPETLSALSVIASVTPVTMREAAGAALIVLRLPEYVSIDAVERLNRAWTDAMVGTPLEGVRTVVLQAGIDIEILRIVDDRVVVDRPTTA